MLSIVIPIYNEEESLENLVGEIFLALEPLPFWELILVDDGSQDNSWKIIQALSEEKKNIKGLRLQKNYGQTAALQAGFSICTAPYIATCDGDGQNNPFDIINLFSLAQSGKFDLVTGKRKKRRDSFIKRVISRSANFFRNSVLKDPSTDTGCSLKIFKKEALEKVKLFKGMHRFFPALFAIEGFSVVEIPCDHRPRRKGKSKYSLFSRGFSVINDLLAVWWMKKRKINYVVEENANVQ